MLNDKMWYVNVKILRTVIAQILRIYGIKLFFCSRKLRFCQVFVIKRSRGQNTDHYTIELFSLDIDTIMKVCLPNQRINRFLKCESAFKRHFQKGEGTFSEYCEFITVPMLKLKNSNNDRTPGAALAGTFVFWERRSCSIKPPTAALGRACNLDNCLANWFEMSH